MAGVQNNSMSPDQKSMEQAAVAEKESDFVNELVKSVDLPSSLNQAINDQLKKDEEPEEEEEVSEEEEESEKTKDSEDSEDSDETEENKDSEEELIPRSKFQKRIDELTREKKQLEARLSKVEEAQSKPSTKDEDLEKLQNMSEDELKVLKRQVRIAQIENSSNKENLMKLIDLEEKVDGVMRDYPRKVQESQVSKFNDAVRQTSSEIEGFNEKHYKEIFSYAKKIYDSAPELQGSVTGQARAWNLAKDHYLSMKEISDGKSKATDLQRQVNTLKKKVSVDTSSRKGSDAEDDAKLFKKAKYGTTRDKENFIRKTLNTDSFIPEEFLNR